MGCILPPVWRQTSMILQKEMIRIGILVILALLITSCRDFTGPELSDDLSGIEWDLMKFQQPDGIRRDIGNTRITLLFQEDGLVTGRGYTYLEGWENWEGFEYQTTYEVGDSQSISVGVPVKDRTVTAYPHPSRWLEYERAIHLAESYMVNAYELIIQYEGGWALVFDKYSSPPTEVLPAS